MPDQWTQAKDQRLKALTMALSKLVFMWESADKEWYLSSEWDEEFGRARALLEPVETKND